VRVGEYDRSGECGRLYGTYDGESSDGGGILGAVSSTEGFLDSELTVGLYDRVGDELEAQYKGKPGSHPNFDFAGSNWSTNRTLSFFLGGI
jgi:hypothetical protein